MPGLKRASLLVLVALAYALAPVASNANSDTGVHCDSGGTPQGSVQCTAAGTTINQDCPDGTPCRDIVQGESDAGSRLMQQLGEQGVCKPEPPTDDGGGNMEQKCSVVEADTPVGVGVYIKVSWRCCPSEWDIEIGLENE